MFKHKVIARRKERSWRSRRSKHIVGLCTLEAVAPPDRFANLGEHEYWQAKNGVATIDRDGRQVEFPLKCRYWTLEEVVQALGERDRLGKPVHEFYTVLDRENGSRPTRVYKYRSQDRKRFWISTPGNNVTCDNLDEQSRKPGATLCAVSGCKLIPSTARPAQRGHSPDC